jgi:hypothetical protein
LTCIKTAVGGRSPIGGALPALGLAFGGRFAQHPLQGFVSSKPASALRRRVYDFGARRPSS